MLGHEHENGRGCSSGKIKSDESTRMCLSVSDVESCSGQHPDHIMSENGFGIRCPRSFRAVLCMQCTPFDHADPGHPKCLPMWYDTICFPFTSYHLCGSCGGFYFNTISCRQNLSRCELRSGHRTLRPWLAERILYADDLVLRTRYTSCVLSVSCHSTST
jgi:hypothetical protein